MPAACQSRGSERDTGFPRGESSDVTFLTGGGPQQITWKHTLDSVGCALDTKAPLGEVGCVTSPWRTQLGASLSGSEQAARGRRDVARQADPCFAGLGASGITLKGRGRRDGGGRASSGTGCLPSAPPRARHRAWLLVEQVSFLSPYRALLPPLYR